MAFPAMDAIGSPAAAPPLRFLSASFAAELGVLLALSVFFPFLVHLLPVPADARLGPRLLPLFYAPLMAVLWGRNRSAWLVAALAPWINLAVTHYPPLPTAVVATAELLGFVLAMRAGCRWLGRQPYLAAPAYAAAKAVSFALVALFPRLVDGAPAGLWAARTAALALPGVGVLLLINLLAARVPPSGSAAA